VTGRPVHGRVPSPTALIGRVEGPRHASGSPCNGNGGRGWQQLTGGFTAQYGTVGPTVDCHLAQTLHSLPELGELSQHHKGWHLFKHSYRQAHCLYHLYTAKHRPPGAKQLRTRGHDFELPIIKDEFNKLNFIVQLLFSYVWFCVLLYYLHFVFYCTHVRMSYVLNAYLLTYLLAILVLLFIHSVNSTDINN